MAYNLSEQQLKEIEARTGTRDLSRTQFNVRLPGGIVIPAGINPGQAATIELGGGVLDRGTPAGASIASGYMGQNVVNPQAEWEKALQSTPISTIKPTNTPSVVSSLPPATSIVDYLKSQGKASDFDSRQKLYESLGMGSTLGEYRGTALQNTQLLKTIQSQSGQAQTGTPPLTQQMLNDKAQTELAVPQQFRDLVPPAQTVQPTAEDILTIARNRPGVVAAEEQARMEKEALAAALPGQKEKVAQASAASGTTFSPRFYDQPIAAVDAEKIAKELNIDLSLAKVVASAIEQDQADKLKEQTNKINQLTKYYESLGYAYNPTTGEVIEIPGIKEEKRAQEAKALAEQKDKEDKYLIDYYKSLGIAYNPLTKEKTNIPKKTGTDEEYSPEAIEAFTGEYIKTGELTRIPSSVRDEVLVKAREYTIQELESDIDNSITKNDYKTPDDLIKALIPLYPEIKQDEIKRIVNLKFPKVQESVNQQSQSFFDRLWGFVKEGL